MNSKEQYWKEKQERLEFQKNWATWRQELIKRVGAGMTQLAPWMFTQNAYREYLELKKLQEEEKTAHAGTHIEMTQPPEYAPIVIDDTVVATTATTE